MSSSPAPPFVEPTPVIATAVVKPKRVLTDAQRESLRQGRIRLSEKRQAAKLAAATAPAPPVVEAEVVHPPVTECTSLVTAETPTLASLAENAFLAVTLLQEAMNDTPSHVINSPESRIEAEAFRAILEVCRKYKNHTEADEISDVQESESKRCPDIIADGVFTCTLM